MTAERALEVAQARLAKIVSTNPNVIVSDVELCRGHLEWVVRLEGADEIRASMRILDSEIAQDNEDQMESRVEGRTFLAREDIQKHLDVALQKEAVA